MIARIGDALRRPRPPADDAAPVSFRHLGRDVGPDQALRLARRLEHGNGHVAIFVHGLGTDERNWWMSGAGLIRDVQGTLGWTPLFLRYDATRRISANGEGVARAIEALVADAGATIRRIRLIGHSMGGMVTRAALAALEARNSPALSFIDRLYLLATPNGGVELGRLVPGRADAPASAQLGPGARILRRALPDGVFDVRFGLLTPEDAARGEAALREGRVPTRAPRPTPDGVRVYGIAGSLWRPGADAPTRGRHDGVVTIESAAGLDDVGDLDLVATGRFCEIPMLVHQLIPTSRRVATVIGDWDAAGR